jgi:hypothetical protein
MSFFLGLFRRRRVVGLREQRHQEIADLGYSLVKQGQLRSGRKLLHGYTIVSPSGEVLDNHGMGYSSSYEALAAIKKHVAEEQGGEP